MGFDRVTIRRMGWFYCARDWSWESLGKPQGQSLWPSEKIPYTWNWDLWTVLEGSGHLVINDQTYDLSSGDCFVLQGSDHLIGTHAPHDPLVVVAVHFDYLDTDGNLILARQHPLYHKIEHLRFFTHLLERIDKAWHDHKIRTSIAEFWLHACLEELEQQDKYTQLTGSLRKQVTYFEQLCKEIRDHPEKRYCIDELAERSGYTRRHFARLFKEFQGLSPQDFIVNSRIEKARSLLYSSSYSIGRIAELAGYHDISFFSRHFKARTGLSPTQCRRYYKQG